MGTGLEGITIPESMKVETSAPARSRVLIVGMDGVTFTVIDPLLRKGQLPTFRKLIESGARGASLSPHPTNSYAAWTSILTGTNPGQHGIYHVETPLPNSVKMTATHTAMRANRPFYRILSDAGRRVVVLNVPMTYPAEPVNGFMVAGRPIPAVGRIHGTGVTYPEGLHGDFARVGYRPPYAIRCDLDPAVYVQSTESVLTLAQFLMAHVAWDVFMVAFLEPDRFQHRIKDPERIGEFYKHMDGILGRIIQGVDSQTHRMVVSDHGMRPCRRSFYLDRWLVQEKYMAIRPIENLRQHVFEQGWTPNGLGTLVKRHVYRWLSGWAHGRSPSTPRPGSLLSRIADRIQDKERHVGFDPIDWSRTRVYMRRIDVGGNSAALRISPVFLAGQRDPQSARRALIEELSAKLKTIVHPDTGESLVESVTAREQYYAGSKIHRLPDLVVQLRIGYQTEKTSSHPQDLAAGPLYETRERDAQIHENRGIWILAGPAIQPGSQIEKARIFDVVPTALYLSGHPVPDYMDGRVVTEAFRPEWLVGHPVTREPMNGDLFGGREYNFAGPEALDKEVEEDLRKMGYLR